jgi:cytochrome c oxidase subunit II
MKRSAIWVGTLWVVLVVVGELLVFGPTFLPAQFAEEAKVVDDAYILLSALAVPVFALVLAVVIYSVFGFRDRGDEFEDGPPIKTNRRVVVTWMIVTSGLAIFVLINPGFVGLADIRGEASADMVIEVEAQRWQWNLTYPNGSVVNDELVLPVDTRVRFDVTSIDILHSFWIPAFRTKIDAVPGRATQLFVTPTRIGTRDDDTGLRVQCAELCGPGHGIMAIPVRVVTEAEFASWMDELVVSASLNRGGG